MVDYRLVVSRTAKKLRVRVGPNGVQVTQPMSRSRGEVSGFLRKHEQWLLQQLQRVASLGSLRRSRRPHLHHITFRGRSTPVHVKSAPHQRGNRVAMRNGSIVIQKGSGSSLEAQRSLQKWLRREARRDIVKQLFVVTAHIKRQPNTVYVMGQRTKWGNCSAMRNLSFNWRLILAPEFVLRYIVTHEAVHLALLNHSPRFWLTVQSLCPEANRARLWLAKHGSELFRNPIDLAKVCKQTL
jgi:predicted metal-dependent hydrolase